MVHERLTRIRQLQWLGKMFGSPVVKYQAAIRVPDTGTKSAPTLEYFQQP
jgi:hypothetical protein